MMVQPGTCDTTSIQRFASRTAGAVLLVASIVLVAQVLAIGVPLPDLPEFGPARTTTLLLLLAGLGLWLSVERSALFRRWCARFCGALVATAGVLPLIAAFDAALG